jgi:hypothetical protein
MHKTGNSKLGDFMKILILSLLPLVLMTVTARAANGLYLQCSDGKVIAFVYLTAQSASIKSTTNECNMGVGDEPTDCKQVVNFYEDKRAVVSYSIRNQLMKKDFRVRRWNPRSPSYDPSHPLFSGHTTLLVSPELQDQIYLSENPTNSLAYVLNFIRISGEGPASKNLGRVELPCRAEYR